MADLIDRQALLEIVQYRLPDEHVAGQIIKKCVNITRENIKKLPAVDAVPVVRCKDCKHYRESENAERAGIKFCYRLKHPAEDRHIGCNFAYDDFCSRGERKDQ